jgi:hypothetical protein
MHFPTFELIPPLLEELELPLPEELKPSLPEELKPPLPEELESRLSVSDELFGMSSGESLLDEQEARTPMPPIIRSNRISGNIAKCFIFNSF